MIIFILVGLTTKCPKCKGTGNMGFMSAQRCNMCTNGLILLSENDETLLFEWIEGYLDPDTDNEWLEEQLKRLIKQRKNKKKD